MPYSAEDARFLDGLKISPFDHPRAWCRVTKTWVAITHAEARNPATLEAVLLTRASIVAAARAGHPRD